MSTVQQELQSLRDSLLEDAKESIDKLPKELEEFKPELSESFRRKIESVEKSLKELEKVSREPDQKKRLVKEMETFFELINSAVKQGVDPEMDVLKEEIAALIAEMKEAITKERL